MSGEHRMPFAQKATFWTFVFLFSLAVGVWAVSSVIMSERVRHAYLDEQSRQVALADALDGWMGTDRGRYVLHAGNHSRRWAHDRAFGPYQAPTATTGDRMTRSIGQKIHGAFDTFLRTQVDYVPLIVWRLLHLAGWIVGFLPLFFIAFYMGRWRAARAAVAGDRPSSDLYTWSFGLWLDGFAVLVAILVAPIAWPLVYLIPLSMLLFVLLLGYVASVAARV